MNLSLKIGRDTSASGRSASISAAAREANHFSVSIQAWWPVAPQLAAAMLVLSQQEELESGTPVHFSLVR